MNTNARGRLLARFLAKIVIIYLILSASPLCKGWHGFLPPKKVLKTQNFHPAPRSHQPVPFFGIFLHLSQDHFFSSDITADYTLLPLLPGRAWNI